MLGSWSVIKTIEDMRMFRLQFLLGTGSTYPAGYVLFLFFLPDVASPVFFFLLAAAFHTE